LLTEDKVDSFNFPTQKELLTLVERNSCFSFERMEPLVFPERIGKALNFQMIILHLSAAWEELIKGHFGTDIIDELFDLLEKEMVEFHLVRI
jgi:hypothetical protein